MVTKLLGDASGGSGKRYLVQHSAGSGKSNSITWLAHQLTELTGEGQGGPVFDSVIVVTDRRVLEKQLRDNIAQFAQVKGVVEAITRGSRQLRLALEGGKKIIVTTIQKFPFVCDDIRSLPGKSFAILIDEAHSSQALRPRPHPRRLRSHLPPGSRRGRADPVQGKGQVLRPHLQLPRRHPALQEPPVGAAGDLPALSRPQAALARGSRPRAGRDGGHRHGRNAKASRQDEQTVRIAHDDALKTAMLGLMKDHTQLYKLYANNPDFKRALADALFRMTIGEEVA